MPAKPSVFISYRRKTSAELARYFHLRLKTLDYDTFLDVETINGGRFANIIKKEIINRDSFVVILTPETLESDWVIREIQTAFEYDKPIIPVMAQGFSFEKPLPDNVAPSNEVKDLIETLRGYDAVRWDHDFADAAFGSLVKSIDPNYQEAAAAKPKAPIRTEILVAIIGGIFLVIGAAINILPSLLSRSDNLPTQIAVVASPTNSPAPTNTPALSETPIPPTNTSPATIEPTVTTDSAATLDAQQTTIAVMIENTQTALTATANARPTNTPSPVPPTTTYTPLPPTATFTPVPPAAYPCSATISGTSGALLNQVHVRPQANSPFAAPVQQASSVSVLEAPTVDGGKSWYHIKYNGDKNQGWITSDYIKSSTCPA